MKTLDSEVLAIRGDLSNCPICNDKPVALCCGAIAVLSPIKSYRICCGNMKCRFFFSTYGHSDQRLAAKEWQETIAKIRSRILRVEQTRGVIYKGETPTPCI